MILKEYKDKSKIVYIKTETTYEGVRTTVVNKEGATIRNGVICLLKNNGAICLYFT